MKHSRRNPARREIKNPYVVLVRRFDPSGEELPRWETLYRDDEGLRFFALPAARKAALNPPRDADLHVGDLILALPVDELSDIDARAKDENLCVVAPDAVKRVPDSYFIVGSWLSQWETDASSMLYVSTKVDRRRLVMAACACARLALPLWTKKHPMDRRPLVAIETAEKWALGEASVEDVLMACQDSGAAAWVEDGSFSQTANIAARIAAVISSGEEAQSIAREVSNAFRFASGFRTTNEEMLRVMAPLVARWIPLPVVLLSEIGYPDAIPFKPREVSP